MARRLQCANKLCQEPLSVWQETGLYCGWRREKWTGRVFCPSCRRMITRTFVITSTATGALCGIIFGLLKWKFGG